MKRANNTGRLLGFVALIGLIAFPSCQFYESIFAEQEAKRLYRDMKESMVVTYQADPESFHEISNYCLDFPEIDFIHFYEDGSYRIVHNKSEHFLAPPIAVLRNPVSLELDMEGKQSPQDRKAVAQLYDLGSQYESTIHLGEKEDGGFYLYDSLSNSSIKLEDNYYLEFSGFSDEKDFEVLLKLIGITKEQLTTIKLLMQEIAVGRWFRKDTDGNLFLGYSSYFGLGSFEYVIPKEDFKLNSNIDEIGVIDPFYGVYWQYGSLPIMEAIVCVKYPMLIRN